MDLLMHICMHFVPVLRRYKYTHMFALFSCLMIVRSFLELVKLLLQHHAICGKGFYILSACFNQEPLESYVGNVQAAGRGRTIPQCGRC